MTRARERRPKDTARSTSPDSDAWGVVGDGSVRSGGQATHPGPSSWVRAYRRSRTHGLRAAAILSRARLRGSSAVSIRPQVQVHATRSLVPPANNSAGSSVSLRVGSPTMTVPLRRPGMIYVGCSHLVHKKCDYLPGCSRSCSALENTRPRISMVLTSEVNPDAAKIMASTTNW